MMAFERRAQLVAHIGEKARFRAARLFGHVARGDERALVRLAFGNVARHRHDVGDLAVHGARRAAAHLRHTTLPSWRRKRTSAVAARPK